MSNKSRFAGVLSARQAISSEDVDEVPTRSTQTAPELQPIEPHAKMGRPKTGKRSRPDHVQVTAYLPRDIHSGVMLRLAAERYQDKSAPDFSELVGELLTEWLHSKV